jgi:glycosyltransferase involved in cell wall biosynthesis
MPKVTVLMSAYNSEHYLLESIESILNQTFKDFEFLIINDGSTDKTREIILSVNDPRIHLIDNEENLGLTRSLNKGLQIAQGEFVARQDADDISEPERLQHQVDFLEAHPEVALLGTWHKEVDAQGNLVGMWNLPSDWIQICWALLFYTPFVHTSVMMRKATILQKIGFYNEDFSYSQDYELWARAARTLPVFSLKERLVRTRVNPFSMTATYGSKTLEGFQLRASTVSHLLGFDEISMKLKELRLNQMTSFLFDFSYDSKVNFKELSRLEIIRIMEELSKLHEAFCETYSFTKAEYRKHRAEVYAQIGHRVLDLTYFYLEKDTTLAWELLIRAFRLYPTIGLTKKYFKLTLMLLLKPQAIKVAG